MRCSINCLVRTWLARTRLGHSLVVACVSATLIGGLGCARRGVDNNSDPPPPSPLNVVIIDDLSDRISAPTQAARDTAILRLITDAFFDRCRDVGFPFSRDRLRFQGVRTTLLDNDLVVDVQKLNLAGEPVVKTLRPRLATFLSGCLHSYSSQAQFNGADLWGYFKDDMEAVLKPAPFENKIIMFTDGYLNFNSSLQNQRPVNTVMHVAELRHRDDWEKEFPQLALAGVGHKFDRTQILILELAPKDQPASIHEMDILKTYWAAFCDSLGVDVGAHGARIYANSLQLSAVADKLHEFLEAP